MSILSNILNKLGLGGAHAETPSASNTQTSVAPSSTAKSSTSTSKSVSQVDVVAQLERASSANKEKLNWKTSIVDLLKLLGLDSSPIARRELAIELDCPTDKMHDSAQMNTWLHKTVMRKLAENGGNIPAELAA